MNSKADHRAASVASDHHEVGGLLSRYVKKVNHENFVRLQENLKHIDETVRKQVEERPLVMVGAGFAFGMFMGTSVGIWAARTAVRVGWASLKGSLANSASDAVREAFPTAKV